MAGRRRAGNMIAAVSEADSTSRTGLQTSPLSGGYPRTIACRLAAQRGRLLACLSQVGSDLGQGAARRDPGLMHQGEREAIGQRRAARRRVSKTGIVQPANRLFQFAFIFDRCPAHGARTHSYRSSSSVALPTDAPDDCYRLPPRTEPIQNSDVRRIFARLRRKRGSRVSRLRAAVRLIWSAAFRHRPCAWW